MRGGGFEGDPEAAREAVAGAARNEPESGGSIDEGACDFIHGAVAPDGDDDISAGRNAGKGEICGVTGVGSCGDDGV